MHDDDGAVGTGAVPEPAGPGGRASGVVAADGLVPGPAAPGDVASGDRAAGDVASGDAVPGDAVPGGSGPGAGAVPRAAIEAILFVADRPISTAALANIVEADPRRTAAALADLRADYDTNGRGVQLREVAGGWRIYTRDDYAGYVERYVLDGQQSRLSQAALETLAVIAYRQPVTRGRVSAIRGVSVDGVIRTLLGRGLIEECGSEPGTGGLLYRTTEYFLERLGIVSLEELPSLAPFLPELDGVDDVASHS